MPIDTIPRSEGCDFRLSKPDRRPPIIHSHRQLGPLKHTTCRSSPFTRSHDRLCHLSTTQPPSVGSFLSARIFMMQHLLHMLRCLRQWTAEWRLFTTHQIIGVSRPPPTGHNHYEWQNNCCVTPATSTTNSFYVTFDTKSTAQIHVQKQGVRSCQLDSPA